MSKSIFYLNLSWFFINSLKYMLTTKQKADLGFIFTGLFILVALFAGTLLTSMNSYGGASAMVGAGFITAIYLVIAAINFFMSLFLYRFASKTKAGLYSNDQDTLNSGFANLKNLYKMIGIIAIIYLAFIVLAIIFGVGAALMQ